MRGGDIKKGFGESLKKLCPPLLELWTGSLQASQKSLNFGMTFFPGNNHGSKTEKANLGNQLSQKHARFVQIMWSSVLRAPAERSANRGSSTE